MDNELGQNGQQILKRFRNFASSYISQFKSEKDRVFELLKSSQQYSSGIYREGLLRKFLTDILPDSVSVNSGFIYGFEVVNTSGQIDIIIWDSARYSAVFKTPEFVIVPPESVIAVITVKSNMNKSAIQDGLKNISSIIALDYKYRYPRRNEDGKKIFRSISKYFVSFRGRSKESRVGDVISEYYIDLLSENQELTNELIDALKNMDVYKLDDDVMSIFDLIYPKMILSIDEKSISFITGFGPIEDQLAENRYGDAQLRRVPYLNSQDSRITTHLEKFVASILRDVYLYLETPGLSFVAAWSDHHPAYGFRFGDTVELKSNEEITEKMKESEIVKKARCSWPLLDVDKNKYVEIKKEFPFDDGYT